MLALIRPLLGLLFGIIICGCSKSEAPPGLMKMPTVLSGENDAHVLSTADSNLISSEDIILLSMATGPAPKRPDALSFETRCWSEKEPHRIMKHQGQGPFRAKIPVYELIPEQALHPAKKIQELNCLWDISLKDDGGHINFQKDIPVTVKLEGGGLKLLFQGNPTEVLHEYIYEQYELTPSGSDQAPLEVVCEDLGTSNGLFTSTHLQALISGYLQATAQTLSMSDFLKCRILSRSEAGRRFTQTFTLIRNYRPLTMNLKAVLQKSEFMEIIASISNPNPFPGYVFIYKGPLWKDVAINYNGSGRFATAHLGEGVSAWRARAAVPVAWVARSGEVKSGHKVLVKPGESVEVTSRTNLRGALCWSPHGPHIGDIIMHLADPLPIFTWKDGAPTSPLSDANHLKTLPVTHQKDNPLLTRSCH